MNYNIDYSAVTDRYYSEWVGTGSIAAVRGVMTVYSAERDKTQPGYPSPFGLYCLCQPGRIIISYGDSYSREAAVLGGSVDAAMPVESVAAALTEVCGTAAAHNVKYLYTGGAVDSGAVILTSGDYSAYRDFFERCNPGCKTDGWLRDYFDEMTGRRLCAGVFERGALVSCTDAPSMPYLPGLAQEIGINTLPEYRGRGYATAACAKCAGSILALGKCPLWSTDIGNLASQSLAEKIGFVRYAEVLTIA